MKAMVNDTKRRRVIYDFDGKKLELVMGLSAIADMQDKFGDIEKAFADVTVRTLISIATILINDAVAEHNEKYSPAWDLYTEREVGRLIGIEDVEPLKNAIFEVMGISLPETEAEGEAPSPAMQKLLDEVEIKDNPKNADAESNETK